MTKKSIWRLFILLLVLFGMGVLTWQVTQAQQPTTLSFSPAAAEVELGDETVTVDLWVSNAVELNAFDVTLSYDPALLQFESWAYGGFLTNLWTVEELNQPGNFSLSATQLAQTPKSGSGSLLKLTFSGVSPGTSALIITEAILADIGGSQTEPDDSPGEIQVFPPRFNLTGRITLQGQEEFSGIMIDLGMGSTYQFGPYSAITNAGLDNNFQIDQVVSDIYIVTTQQPRYLNISASMNVAVNVNGDTDMPDLHLMGGNAVWTDNVIDISDASVVGAWYEVDLATYGPDEGVHPDVNFDGVVNIQDLAMVSGNYHLTSEGAYVDWQP